MGNIFAGWLEFKSDKKAKTEILDFERNLEDNIFKLYEELRTKTYRHSHYTSFYITDPKLRHIHKAEVRDRVVHHAIFRVLYPIFDHGFIFDSYSCRINKGVHMAVDRLEYFIKKVSKNYSSPCFVLKCDIKKFFDSVDHQILFEIIKRKISDPELLRLLNKIISSYPVEAIIQLNLFGAESRGRERAIRPTAEYIHGIPIGNLTSQLFANIYMNEFDQFVKHKLKVKYYCRYTDDFVIVSDNTEYLQKLLPAIQEFLENNLKLKLHPNKVSIRKVRRGIDFLGYVILPHRRQLRTKTKKRIFKKLKRRVTEFKSGLIDDTTLKQSLNSFLGVLSHADTYELKQKLLNQYWFWLKE